MKSKILVLYKNIKNISGDTSILIVSTILANSIPILLQPFLKRIFEPESFGSLDLYLKIFNVLVAFSSLRYENAILIARRESDARHVLFLSLFVSVGFFILLLVVAAVFGSILISWFPALQWHVLFILPFSVLSYSIFNCTNLYLHKKRMFFLSATTKVLRRAAEGVGQGALGLMKISTGLIWGDLIGNLAQSLVSFAKAKSSIGAILVSRQRIKKVADEFFDLPKYTLIPNVLNTFVLGSLTFIILDQHSLTEVGYLEFTQKILAIPSVFLSIAISQVVFQRVSEMVAREQKILSFIISIMTILLLISFILLLVILYYGNEIFILIGGEEWARSGDYAMILVYSSCATLIFSPLGKVLIALKKFKINSVWEVGKFIAICTLFFLDSTSVLSTLKIYTGIIIVFYIGYGLLIIQQTLKYQSRLA